MPYNVNPPCPTGQKTKIDWQFPGQPQQSTDAGDDYKARQIPGQCLNVNYRIIYTFREAIDNGSTGRTLTRNVLLTNRRVMSADTGVYGINRWYPQDPSVYPFIATVTAQVKLTNNALEDIQVSLTQESNSGAVPGSISFSIIRADGLQDNCGNWILDIYKNQAIIQSITGGLQQPTVTWQCIAPNQCPPNTCDVLCGNTICCYNSEGISVFNYPNS